MPCCAYIRACTLMMPLQSMGCIVFGKHCTWPATAQPPTNRVCHKDAATHCLWHVNRCSNKSLLLIYAGVANLSNKQLHSNILVVAYAVHMLWVIFYDGLQHHRLIAKHNTATTLKQPPHANRCSNTFLLLSCTPILACCLYCTHAVHAFPQSSTASSVYSNTYAMHV